VDAKTRGDTESTPFSVMLGGGYDGILARDLLGGIELDVAGSMRYLKADVDSYTESSGRAQGLNMKIRSQDYDSLVLTLGGTVSRSFDFQNIFGRPGIFLPQVFAEWEHEFIDDPVTIKGQFAQNPLRTTYRYDPDSFDQDYFRVGAGVNTWFMDGPQAYLVYESILGQDEYTEHRFNLGIRWDF
jgi:outer membrane autotransporter protein